MNIAISVTGKDGPGIISALSKALFKTGGNLEDASMTVLEGEFAMIFLADIKPAKQENLFEELKRLERRYQLLITTKVIKRKLVRGRKHQAKSVPWVVSVIGKDRSGIVYRVSEALAHEELNITDLDSRIIGSGKKASYVLILEVDMPKSPAEQKRVIKRLKRLEKPLKVHIEAHSVDSASL